MNRHGYADVLFDTFGTKASSALFDAAIDITYSKQGLSLSVPIKDNSIKAVVAQTYSNYLINPTGEFKTGVGMGDFMTNYSFNSFGKIGQNQLPWFH